MKFPSPGGPSDPGKEPLNCWSGNGLLCSEILAVEVVVTDDYSSSALGQSPLDPQRCSSNVVGAPGFSGSISPLHLKASQLLPHPWEAFVLWQRKSDIRKSVIQKNEQRDG